LILRSVADFVHPDYHATVAERARQMLTQSLSLPPLEMKLLHDDGTQIDVEANGTPITLPDGTRAIQTTIRDITFRRQTEETLAQKARQLAQAQSLAHLGSWEWDIAANVVTWSDELYRVFGLHPQEFGATYEAYLERVHDDDLQLVKQVIENALADQQPFSYEYRIVRPDGKIRFAHSRGEVIVDEQGLPQRMVGTCQDITERKQAEQDLREISNALECAVEGIARLDASGRYVFVNAAYADMLGYDAGQMAGMTWQLFVHPDDRETMTFAYKEMVAQGRVEAEVRGLRRDGSEFHQRVVLVASHDDQGTFAGHYCFMQDISARKFAEDLVKHMALHDPLTALANRRLLHDRFAIALAQARRSGEPLAVASLDLDDFKNVNDTFGHATGDQVLRTVARRLASAVRDGDTVARIGGDEFLLLLPNTGRAGAATITARILREAAKRTALDGSDFHASFSVGIAMFPDDGDDADTLLNCSDEAMYRAKKLGGNKYQFATEDLAVE